MNLEVEVRIQHALHLLDTLRELEEENRRLKKMYAEERLKAEIIQEAMAKKW